MEDDTLVLDAAQRVFAELADPQTILHSKSDDWKVPLWRTVEEMGLPKAWVPEALGGHGLSLSEGFAVAKAAGRSALAIPLIDTMVAGWIAANAGLSLPDGPAAVVIAGSKAEVRIDEGGDLQAKAIHVPFAQGAQSLVFICPSEGSTRVAVVPASDCQIAAGRSLAGDALDGVVVDTHAKVRGDAAEVPVDQVLFLMATCRSLQIAGSLQAILDMSVAYSKERVAFEKTISKFQAVQQNLARLAGEVAAAVAVAESAADTLAHPDTPELEQLLEVASAKIRCGEAAETGGGIAHQVFGAIGFTKEHILHRYTLRALSWREEFGSEAVWARRLGDRVAQRGSAELWQLLSAR